jgi:hypothetical protein
MFFHWFRPFGRAYSPHDRVCQGSGRDAVKVGDELARLKPRIQAAELIFPRERGLVGQFAFDRLQIVDVALKALLVEMYESIAGVVVSTSV